MESLVSRIDLIPASSWEVVELGLDEDPLGREKLKPNRMLMLFRARAPQSYGTQQKVKADVVGEPDARDGHGHYLVEWIVEVDTTSGKVIGAGDGDSMAGDGVLWYRCACKSGTKLCRHVKGVLVAQSRICEADMTNHSYARYWAPKSHAVADPAQPKRVVDVMVERVYLSDILGRRATDKDIEMLM